MGDKCFCWHTRTNPWGEEVPECWGVKYGSTCKCGGDESKCDFYPDKAREHQKTLTLQEIIDIVNDSARKLNKRVPVDFYERLLR